MNNDLLNAADLMVTEWMTLTAHHWVPPINSIQLMAKHVIFHLATVNILFLQENYKLRDQNDDLNAQILSLSLYEACFPVKTKAQCLAAEIDNASRDEVSLL